MAMLGKFRINMTNVNQDSVIPFALVGVAATGAIYAVRLASRRYFVYAYASDDSDDKSRKSLLTEDGEFQNEAVQSVKRR